MISKQEFKQGITAVLRESDFSIKLQDKIAELLDAAVEYGERQEREQCAALLNERARVFASMADDKPDLKLASAALEFAADAVRARGNND